MNKTRAGSEQQDLMTLGELRSRHGDLERRLAELDAHLSLTPDEQIERMWLKKEKLRMKDEIKRLEGRV